MPLIKHRIERFVKREGRRPRILVGSMGAKNHDRDTKLLAAGFAEAGFDVDISLLQLTPGHTARMAIENDVHLICLLCTADKYKQLVTELGRELKIQHAEIVGIVIGGAIPQSDHHSLRDAGASLVLSALPADRAEIHQILDLFDKRT